MSALLLWLHNPGRLPAAAAELTSKAPAQSPHRERRAPSAALQHWKAVNVTNNPEMGLAGHAPQHCWLLTLLARLRYHC